jgi:hypothetical protein
VELRRFVRYRLDLPVTYMWRDARGESERAAGFTWDISMGGMFVVSSQCPPPQSQVWCEVILPRSYTSDAARQLRAAGPVLRTSASTADDHPSGFVIHGSPFLLTDEADKAEWVRLIADHQQARSKRSETASGVQAGGRR